LLNIYSNAIKFTDRDGKILIHIEKERNLNKEFLVISVSDTGIGIKDQNKDKLFHLFGSIKD